jgi:hypothetical protein
MNILHQIWGFINIKVYSRIMGQFSSTPYPTMFSLTTRTNNLLFEENSITYPYK